MSSRLIDEASSLSLLKPLGDRKIWAIGGGKGGVGKSFIISNLAITLARTGKKVLLVDLDLGAANLHTCLGTDIPRSSLSDFLSGRVRSLSEIINQSPIPNLSFISGANDSIEAANLTPSNHEMLINALKSTPTDYLIFDLGAGTHGQTLDYFLLADRPLVALTPEPTSIENSYRFIKGAYFRWLKSVENELGLRSIVGEAMDHKNSLGIRTPNDLVQRIVSINPAKGNLFKSRIEEFKINIIMNQIRTKNDIEIGYAVQSVCKKYFGIAADYIGHLDYDNAVWQSVRKRRPLMLEYPHSPLIHQFSQIVRKLEGNEGHTKSNILRTS